MQGVDALVSAVKKASAGIGMPVENKFGYVYNATLGICVKDEFSYM